MSVQVLYNQWHFSFEHFINYVKWHGNNNIFLSVQCYAWREYKFTFAFLSVCVYVPHNDQLGCMDFPHNALSPQCIVGKYRCVCPSHFLSTRLQIRPFNPLNLPTYPPRPEPPLWVVSYGCKTIPRWRTAAILKIDISPYLAEKSSQFSWNFVYSSRF